MADEVGIRISALRESHHREAHERSNVRAVITDEEAVLAMIDQTDNRTWLDLRPQDIGDLSANLDIRQHAVAEHRATTDSFEASRNLGGRHGDHLHRQRTATEHLDPLGLVGDAGERECAVVAGLLDTAPAITPGVLACAGLQVMAA